MEPDDLLNRCYRQQSHKIITKPKKQSDKVKRVASILKIPKYFLLARALILTQKQIINGYFRSKSFILLY